MENKKIIYTVLLIFWMIIIFLFSNQNGSKSEDISNKFASGAIDTITSVMNQNITSEKKQDLIDSTRFIVRKSAHFFLYLVLGILAYLTFISYGVSKPVLFSILLCVIYASSDEIHQLFTLNRAGRVFDIFVDSLGSITGISLLLLIKSFFNK